MVSTTNSKNLKLQLKLNNASVFFNTYWPLKNFIACNALAGLESKEFDEAMYSTSKLFSSNNFLDLSQYRSMYETGRINPVDLREAFDRLENKPVKLSDSTKAVMSTQTYSELLDKKLSGSITEIVNRNTIKWLKAYFDQVHAQWSMDRKGSLYKTWRELVGKDFSMGIHGVKNWGTKVKALPENSMDLLSRSLQSMNIEENKQESYLTRHLVQLPGWTSLLKFYQESEEDLLTDFVAIKVFYEEVLCHSRVENETSDKNSLSYNLLLDSSAKIDSEDEQFSYANIWQEAYELNYRNDLIKSLASNVKSSSTQNKTNKTYQAVFCIDVRSEPIRRNLEKIGRYTTFGYAGFFGFAMRLKEFGSTREIDVCPALIKPDKDVVETSNDSKAFDYLSGKAFWTAAIQMRTRLKSSLLTAFGLVEMTGMLSAFPLIGKSLFLGTWDKLVSLVKPVHLKTELDTSSFSLEEKIELAKNNLHGIGITSGFSEVVVLCGHGSKTTNNPYASALDCGACGGNTGHQSSRLAVQFLNDREVRAGLIEHDIEIPDSTLFVAAEHNTTCETVEIMDRDSIPESHTKLIEQFEADFRKAGELALEERAQNLPKSVMEKFNSGKARSLDWAQVAPEWGLARNAAFLIAPRSVSENISLDGRVFLHSYDYRKDPDADILEVIMTAPMVVAQWINTQYYLSTVDNDSFGSGSKVFHNVLGDYGVMQGEFSDLKIGLPLESVFKGDGEHHHEPMRLLVVIKAPMKNIDKVLSKHAQVAQLVDNRWIRLVAFEPESNSFYQADKVGDWRKILETDPKEVKTPIPLLNY